jgi:hypothetical protein
MKEETQYDYYEILVNETMHAIKFPSPTELKLDWVTGRVTIQEASTCNKKIYAVFNKDVNIIKQ